MTDENVKTWHIHWCCGPYRTLVTGKKHNRRGNRGHIYQTISIQYLSWLPKLTKPKEIPKILIETLKSHTRAAARRQSFPALVAYQDDQDGLIGNLLILTFLLYLRGNSVKSPENSLFPWYECNNLYGNADGNNDDFQPAWTPPLQTSWPPSTPPTP